MSDSSSIAQYRLHLEILFKSEHPELAPVAGLLVAAERQAAVERRAVEIDASGADAVADSPRAVRDRAGVAESRIG